MGEMPDLARTHGLSGVDRPPPHSGNHAACISSSAYQEDWTTDLHTPTKTISSWDMTWTWALRHCQRGP